MSQLTHTLEPTSLSPASAAPEDPLSPHSAPAFWSPATRIAFRLAFCYFMLYALCCGNATIWEVIPVVGGHISDWLAWPFRHGSVWLAQHLFHLTGVGAKLHGGGSGDRAVDWIAMGIMLVVALLATLIWSLLDRQRTAYPTLFGWFRFTIRLTLGVAMFNYGLAKVFPLQMGPPSLAVLNEPLGNTSPMTMLWTLIAINPLYEMICGAAEVAGGLLILFRRTALLGALLSAFVLSNVVLYNFFFDVPVKIYATHLLLMCLVVIAPDALSLFRYFWQHKPTAPTGVWVPPARRRSFRIATALIEAFFFFMVAVVAPIADFWPAYKHMRTSLQHPSPLSGQWHLTAATTPYLTGDGLPITDIFLEPSGRVMLRATDQALWRAGAQIDDKKHTLMLASEVTGPVTYAIAQPDPSHLTLTPTGKDAAKNGSLSLTRVPLPTHYPLLDRGFHFVNEWGLER